MTQPTPPTENRSPPADAEACLILPYGSRPGQKGGTLIAENVLELSEHERRLRTDEYRPKQCPTCGATMHAHEHRPRLLVGEAELVTAVAIYRCADRDECGAVWRVLPGLLARHLWRAWRTVARAVTLDGVEQHADGVAGPEIAPRTQARWRARLGGSAALIVAVLATAMDVPLLATVVSSAGYRSSRGEVVERFAASHTPPLGGGEKLSVLAGVVHRLAPGARLM